MPVFFTAPTLENHSFLSKKVSELHTVRQGAPRSLCRVTQMRLPSVKYTHAQQDIVLPVQPVSRPPPKFQLTAMKNVYQDTNRAEAWEHNVEKALQIIYIQIH